MNPRVRSIAFAVLGMAAILSLGACSRDKTDATAAATEAAAAPAAKSTAPASLPVTLPQGTHLKVRTATALSTNTQEAGQKFTAYLEEPLVDGATVAAPKGAEVEGIVVEADKGGRVHGRAKLAVRLTRIHTAAGHGVPIETSTVAREARATKRKDAEKIGIGAGVGAAIGAIAGGGKGAAIGAGVGAGAGAGGVLATRGKPSVIPSESVMTFHLRTPVEVTERQ